MGSKLAVLGYPDELETSLQWRGLRPGFEQQFVEQGFVITDFENADYVAFVSYEIGGPVTTTKVGTRDVYGSTGGGTTFHSGTLSSGTSYSGSSYTAPSYGVVGTEAYTYDVTKYTRLLSINIFNKQSEELVFEGRGTSTGRCGIIGEVIDEIGAAVFQKVPSGSGSVSIKGEFDC